MHVRTRFRIRVRVSLLTARAKTICPSLYVCIRLSVCLSVCLCTRIGGDMHSNEHLLVNCCVDIIIFLAKSLCRNFSVSGNDDCIKAEVIVIIGTT